MKLNWSEIAKNGLILASFTILVQLISTLTKTESFAINSILWIIKTAGSIWVLYYFMKAITKSGENIPYKLSFNYGLLITMFSSIACAAFSLLLYYVIAPDTIEKAIDLVFEAFSKQGMDISSMTDINTLEKNLPFYIVISQYIYYSLFGLILSSILANWTKNEVIFTAEEQEEESNVNE